MFKNTTVAVDAIGEMRFEGNIIPHSWYQHIKLPSGEPDLVAIVLLSDIIWWYRPVIERDETTGEIISIRKKFKEDMLQKQHESWSKLFGFTKRQVKDAVLRLVKMGLLKREFRCITTKDGLKVSNVMFLEPILTGIQDITFPSHPSWTISTA